MTRPSSSCQWLPSNSLTFRSYAISHHGWFIPVSPHTTIAGASVLSGKWECHLTPVSLASLTSHHIRKLLRRFPPELVVSFPSVLERAILLWLWFTLIYLNVFINLKNIKVRGKRNCDIRLLIATLFFPTHTFGVGRKGLQDFYFFYIMYCYILDYMAKGVSFLHYLIIQWTEVTKILHI